MNSNDQALLVNQLPVTEIIPSQPEQLGNFLDGYTTRVASSVNSKPSALYALQELGSFKRYFTVNDPQTFRNVYRFTMDVVNENGGVNLATGSTNTFAHGLTNINTPTLLFGTATDTGGRFLPLPYADASAVGDTVQLHATATDIVVTLGATAAPLSQCYVTFEFTKN